MAKERLGSPRARLFVALELPEDVVEGVAALARAFGPVDELRLVRTESLHVTLVFFGYQPEREIERIAAIAFDQPAGPFGLVANAVVPVPQRRPRLYALGLEDAGGALHGTRDRCRRAREHARDRCFSGWGKPHQRARRDGGDRPADEPARTAGSVGHTAPLPVSPKGARDGGSRSARP